MTSPTFDTLMQEIHTQHGFVKTRNIIIEQICMHHSEFITKVYMIIMKSELLNTQSSFTSSSSTYRLLII